MTLQTIHPSLNKYRQLELSVYDDYPPLVVGQHTKLPHTSGGHARTAYIVRVREVLREAILGTHKMIQVSLHSNAFALVDVICDEDDVVGKQWQVISKKEFAFHFLSPNEATIE